MSLPVATLTPYSANRFVFFFSILAIGVVSIYFGYGALDRIGLEVQSLDTKVVDKQFGPAVRAYNTTIAGGRPWIQSRETSDVYMVIFEARGEKTGGLVSRELYESLKVGDTVRAKVRRTRISRRLEALEITKL